jgi:hypothetical protein
LSAGETSRARREEPGVQTSCKSPVRTDPGVQPGSGSGPRTTQPELCVRGCNGCPGGAWANVAVQPASSAAAPSAASAAAGRGTSIVVAARMPTG